MFEREWIRIEKYVPTLRENRGGEGYAIDTRIS